MKRYRLGYFKPRPKRLIATATSPKKNQFSFKSFEESVTSVFSVFSKIIGLIGIVILTSWIVLEHTSDNLHFEDINIPSELVGMGYNSSFIKNNLAEQIHGITKEVKAEEEFEEYVSTREKPELKGDLFGLGISVNQLFDFSFQFFGVERKYVKCEIVKTNQFITAYLHFNSKSTIRIQEKPDSLDKAFEQIFEKASFEILKEIDPTTIAYYYFYKKGKPYYNQALLAARHASENFPDDKKWSLNLMGKIHNERREYDKAIFSLQQAILIDSQFVSAYNNLGIAYLNSKTSITDSLALITFLKAIEMDHAGSYKYARYMLGKTYTQIGKLDMAVKAYKESLKIDPTYSLALNNLGFVYRQLGKSNSLYYDSALQVLNVGLGIATTNLDKARLLSTIGETMFYKGDTVVFFNHIRESLRLGLKFKERDLESEPYSNFKNDPKFQEIFTNQKNN